MKMGEDHNVPLSQPALAVLDEMRNGTQGELIFPSYDGGHLSDMAMLAVLKRMDCRNVTVHGFRATFATWAEECTDFPDGVREAALGGVDSRIPFRSKSNSRLLFGRQSWVCWSGWF